MNEHDFGYQYAEEMHGEMGFDETVDIDEMATSSGDIPEGDYIAMREEGIDNPDPRKFWEGFNSYFST